MRRLDLTQLEGLDLTWRGPEEPARQCVRLVSRWQVSDLNATLVRMTGAPTEASDVLRVAVLRRLTAGCADAFTIDTWIRSIRPASVIVFARCWWNAALLRDYLNPYVRVFASPKFVSGLWRHTSRGLRKVLRLYGLTTREDVRAGTTDSAGEVTAVQAICFVSEL